MLKIFGFSPKREEKLWKSVFWVEMLKWECDSPTESTYLRGKKGSIEIEA